MTSFFPRDLIGWLRAFSTLATLSVVALPVIARRLRRNRDERKAMDEANRKERARMHAENIANFAIMTSRITSVDKTLAVQNGRLKTVEEDQKRQDAELLAIRNHLMDDTANRRKDPRYPTS